MISALFTEKVCVIREGKGEYRKGKWESGDAEEFEINCSMQPLTGDDLKKPEDGERTSEQYNLFCTTELKPAADSTTGDIVSYNGKKFEVIRVERWAGLIPHFKCVVQSLLAREERPGGGEI
jgi:hypothetical protein